MRQIATVLCGALMLAILLAGVPALAEVTDAVRRADELHDREEHQEARTHLLQALDLATADADRAELYWRLARANLNLGDEAGNVGASEVEILSLFEEGEQYANRAMELDPSNYLGYYWKSGNAGRWGQTKGILNSLFKAGPMHDLLKTALQLNPEHADSFYILGQLYEQVPGFPLSFGNADFSVSLGRKAVDLHEAQLAEGIEDETDYDFYTELAKHLHKRNWDSVKRVRQQGKKTDRYASHTDPLEQNLYYEAALDLPDMSDREEARLIIQRVISELGSKTSLKQSDRDDLEEARETQSSWDT